MTPMRKIGYALQRRFCYNRISAKYAQRRFPMKSKKWMIALVIVFFSLSMILTSFIGSGTTGRCIAAKNGSVLLVDGNTPMVLSNRTVFGQDFSRYETGDKLFVIHGAIAESYPAQTAAYLCIRLAKGTKADISSDLIKELSEMGWVEPTH